MNKPIFINIRNRGRPPELRLKILKLMVLYGEMSKTIAMELCMAKYADVSDAMEALMENHFIKPSGTWQKLGGRKHHKLYKVTEKGLKHLLETRRTPDVFWKAITLLCFSIKRPITQNEFENYYIQFERDYLGHFSIPGYFFLTHLFDDVLEQWFQTHDVGSLSLSQKVIECLALHGQLTIKELIEETGAKEEDVIKVLDKYSTKENSSHGSVLSSYKSTEPFKANIDGRNLYYNFLTRLLIISSKSNNKERYELSLFGVLLAMAFIRYHHVGHAYRITSQFVSNSNVSKNAEQLFYHHIDKKEYYNSIAQNYKDKIPFIFGKWNSLEAELGQSSLYGGFDFLIYNNRKSNSFQMSIWYGGNKEFYDDIHMLTYNAAWKLLSVYRRGKSLLEGYEKVKPGITRSPRLTPVIQKLTNLGNIFDYVRITTFLEELRDGYPIISESGIQNLCEFRDIKKIEKIFGDEVCFLFYLNLSDIIFGYAKPDMMYHQLMLRDRHGPQRDELLRVEGSRHSLMAILAKDNDIKKWFSAWIESLIRYRKYTSEQMSIFYAEAVESQKHLYSFPPPAGAELIQHEEYDMTKVCSDIDTVYDY
jgi:hypothetical protein